MISPLPLGGSKAVGQTLLSCQPKLSVIKYEFQLHSFHPLHALSTVAHPIYCGTLYLLWHTLSTVVHYLLWYTYMYDFVAFEFLRRYSVASLDDCGLHTTHTHTHTCSCAIRHVVRSGLAFATARSNTLPCNRDYASHVVAVLSYAGERERERERKKESEGGGLVHAALET